MAIRRLYYGDNLDILREHIPDESVDLIYLDPPFNSKSNYNVLFQTPKGDQSSAQITAFEDTWEWGEQSEHYLNELIQTRGELAQFLDLLVRMLGQNSLSAYLVMMSIRLVELHRVLKSTGSFYLHCDNVASHYLKTILDTIFGAKNFKTEIVWQRTNVHNDSKSWSRVTDAILFYTKSDKFCWNPLYDSYDTEYVKAKYRHADSDGRLYRLDNMTSPSKRPNMVYEWKGHKPPKNGWRYSQETMQSLDLQGKIWYPTSKNRRPQFKRYLDEMPGTVMGNIWTDIRPLNSQAKERLGYPTQKPLRLLERIIQASSNPGDLILDPFCGCGTAVHAAEKLDRQWIGIDITHLAISLIEKRLHDAFDGNVGNDSGDELKSGLEFEVEGTPKTLEDAQDLFKRDAYQFEWWACSLVNAQPYKDKKKGSDSGIDGLIFFSDVDSKSKRKDKTAVKTIVVSIKGGKNVGVSMIRDLRGTMQANDAEMGFFVTMAPPTKPMKVEAAKAGFYQAGNKRNYSRIQIMTIQDLLEKRIRPEFFDLNQGELTFKKAPRQTRDRSSQLNLQNLQDTLDNS